MQNRLVRDIKFFLLSQVYHWKGFLFYKTQASVWMVYSLMSLVYSFVTISVIYEASSGIAGWNYYQMLFLSATSSIVLNVMMYVLDPDAINQMLRTGGMDLYLVKPYGRATIFLSATGRPSSLALIAGAFIMLFYAIANIGFNPLYFISYVVLMVLGTIAFVLFALMLTLLTYHLLKSRETMHSLLSFVEKTARYPLPVYGIMGQLLFTLVLPLGIASYYPAQAFLFGISAERFIEVVIVSLTISVVSYLLFNKLMQYYTSGGG